MAPGRSVDDYGAPLFIAWQLTNRCQARCLACCEESGPDRAWKDELRRDEALAIAREIVGFGVPYVAFGGGEPLDVPFCWDLFDTFTQGGVELKLETDGSLIDDAAADRLAALAVRCVQVSVDGATAETHARARPGSSFDAATNAIRRLVARRHPPQFVFVPNRINLHELIAAFDLAGALGCAAFVTGPMMRLGRAAAQWDTLACSPESWQLATDRIRRHAAVHGGPSLSIYPWDILTEMGERLASPQAMLLIVPNGKVKLMNALPFVAADLRVHSMQEAWDAYRNAWRSPEVRTFVTDCRTNPELLRHANATWSVR